MILLTSNLKQRGRWESILRELNTFWILEETKAKQRARDMNIVEENRNTCYIHAVANQRRRKKLIHVLDGSDGPSPRTKTCLR
jgi:hypothetical protein